MTEPRFIVSAYRLRGGGIAERLRTWNRCRDGARAVAGIVAADGVTIESGEHIPGPQIAVNVAPVEASVGVTP